VRRQSKRTSKKTDEQSEKFSSVFNPHMFSTDRATMSKDPLDNNEFIDYRIFMKQSKPVLVQDL